MLTNCYRFILLTLIVAACSSTTGFAQQTSRGRDFYVTFMPNIHNNGSGSEDSLYVYVIADSATTGTLTYYNRAGTMFTQNIVITNPSQVWQFQVPFSNFELRGYNQSQNFSTNNDLERVVNTVFHVQTSRDVACYALNKAQTTSDASIVLPTPLLGSEYYVLAYKADGVVQNGNLDPSYTPSQFVVVAVDSNTQVTVTPTAPTTQSGIQTKVITLQKGEAYLFQSQYSLTSLRLDLSGSRVSSNKPVAVFAGHQRATVPVELRGQLISRDHLYEQMLPTSVWGKSYIITPLAQPQGITTTGNDLWRVVAQDDGTVLKFNNNQVAVLNRGQVYEAPLTAPGLLFASKKVMVALYKKTHSSNNNNLRPGDPFMMIIPPRSQYLTKYRYTNIQAAGSFDQQFITLVTTRPNVSSILYDGTQLSATFTDIPNTCFAYANVSVTDQAHTIESPQPIGLYVYGFGDADSYGYVGGMALRPDVEGVDIDAGEDRLVCIGDTVRLTVAGAARNIRWRPTTGLNCDTCKTVVVRALQTTTYVVTATDSLGCDGADTVVVNVRKFLVDAGRDTSLCPGGDSVLLSVRGVNGSIIKVRWTPRIGLACDTCLSTKAKPAVTTSYIAVAIDSLGCTGLDTVKVTIRPPLEVDAGPDLEFCKAADSVTLKVTVKNGMARSVRWTPSAGVSCDTCVQTKARPSGNTMYYVTVRDSMGCEGTDSVLVQLKTKAGGIRLPGAQFICFKNDSARLSVIGTVSAVRWKPSTGVSCDSCISTFAKPPVTTLYTCEGFDAQGCQFVDTMRVVVLPKATVDATPDTAACTSTGVVLRAEGSYTFIEWTPVQGLSCSNCPAPTAIPPMKTMVYTVRVRNGNSADCESTDSVVVKYAKGIEGLLPSTLNLCVGDTAAFTLNFGGKVRWKPSTYVSCDTCKSVVLRPKANIRYTVEGDSAGCASRAIVDVKVSQRATLAAPRDTSICRGDSVVLNTQSSSTTNGILWIPYAGLDCPTCLRPKASPSVTTRYIVTSGSGQCAVSDTVVVSVKDRPAGSLTPADTSLCEGGAVQLRLTLDTTGTVIEWTPTTGLSCNDCPNPVATPTSSTTYAARVRATNGCDTTLVTRIGVGTRPAGRITTPPATICRGNSLVASVSGDTTSAIRWIPSAGVSCDTCATTSITPDSSRLYIVRVSDRISGCSTYDTLRVTVNQLPVLDSLTPSQRLCQKQQMRLYAATGTRYVWSPAAGLSDANVQSPIASPTSTTTYTVRIYNAEGCWTEGTTTITVAPCGDSIKTDPQGGTTPFIACDSTDASFGIRNLGQIAIQIDSVSVWRVSNADADRVFLAQQNAARFPVVLQPNEDLNPAFRVRLVPAAAGPFTVVFRVHTSNGTRIDSVRFSGTGTKEPLLFYLGQTSIPVDSSFVFPIWGESSAWGSLKIREVIASITFNPASMQFDTAKVVELGDMLDATWTVSYDKLTSTSGTAVFKAAGSTPLSTNGTLIRPSFKTLLGSEQRFVPVLSYSLPALRIPCAEERKRDGFVSIVSCVADLRRVALGTTQFALVSIAPNPAESHLVNVRYSLGFDCDADVQLYDLAGREVARLVYGPHQSGVYEARFDSSQMPAGEYLCVLSAAGQKFTAKLVIK